MLGDLSGDLDVAHAAAAGDDEGAELLVYFELEWMAVDERATALGLQGRTFERGLDRATLDDVFETLARMKSTADEA